MSNRPPTGYSQTDNSRVLLTLEHKSEALTEITRAYLHTAVPSLAIQALLKGVRHFKLETTAHADPEDTILLDEVEKELIRLFVKIRERENELYNQPPTDNQPPAPLHPSIPMPVAASIGTLSAPYTPLGPPSQASLRSLLPRPFTPGGSFDKAAFQHPTVRAVPVAKVR